MSDPGHIDAFVHSDGAGYNDSNWSSLSIAERRKELQRRADLRKRARPLCYVALLPRLVEVARSLGYALCVHGSLVRDLDLVACPWTDEAADPPDLVLALAEASGGVFIDGSRANPDGSFVQVSAYEPTQKPHGRLAWTVHTGAEMWIDLSVMPRREVDRSAVAQPQHRAPPSRSRAEDSTSGGNY